MYAGNQYSKKEVGGRGGAYKLMCCRMLMFLLNLIFSKKNIIVEGGEPGSVDLAAE